MLDLDRLQDFDRALQALVTKKSREMRPLQREAEAV
jgi:hypothetical protein